MIGLSIGPWRDRGNNAESLRKFFTKRFNEEKKGGEPETVRLAKKGLLKEILTTRTHVEELLLVWDHPLRNEISIIESKNV